MLRRGCFGGQIQREKPGLPAPRVYSREVDRSSRRRVVRILTRGWAVALEGLTLWLGPIAIAVALAVGVLWRSLFRGFEGRRLRYELLGAAHGDRSRAHAKGFTFQASLRMGDAEIVQALRDAVTARHGGLDRFGKSKHSEVQAELADVAEVLESRLEVVLIPLRSAQRSGWTNDLPGCGVARVGATAVVLADPRLFDLPSRGRRGIWAHEIAHARSDKKWSDTVVSVMGPVRASYRLALWAYLPLQIAWPIAVVASALVVAVGFAFLRRREYSADAASLTVADSDLAFALQRFYLTKAVGGAIVAPPTGFLRTHPDTGRRISRLRRLSAAR